MRYRYALGFALAILAPVPAGAQDGVIRDLLATARSRLNDLKFHDADSIAQAILDFRGLRRADQIQALQLSVGARFPEQTDAQDRPAAATALRQLIQIAPGTPLPREFAWAGLDSLFLQVKRQVFGAAATPRASTILTGPDDRGAIEVVASRPAHFALSARDANGQFVKLDSIGPIERGTLRFSILRDMRQLLRSGPLELSLIAIDPEWNDTIQIKYDAVVDAPPLDLVALPRALEAKDLLPEATRPKRIGGILGGLFVAAGTVLASQVLRDKSFADRGPQSDRRAVSLGITLGIGAGAGVWFLDKGAKIPKNIEANVDTHRKYDEALAYSKTENQRRINNYRGELKINPEPR